jgi:simple sugar transport system permease protein
MFLARGVALVLTSEKRLSITATPAYDTLGSISLAGFNLPALTFMAMIAVGAVVAHRTRFGRAVYAVGGNESSALLMGLPVGATKVKVYTLSGLCAALGGVMHAIHNGAGDAAEAGKLLELDAIAAVVIGGTLLSGGVGTVLGTLLGVLILAIISTLPSYVDGLNSWWTKIFIGALLLGFIVLQRLLQRKTA